MKKIGQKDDGTYIVEMNPDELGVLTRLGRVNSGLSDFQSIHLGTIDQQVTLYDLTQPLQQVLAYTTLLHEAQSTKNSIDSIVRQLKGIDDGE